MPEDGVEYESFIHSIISADSLLLYKNKYYLQVYLDNCAYTIVDKQMTDYMDENLFEGDKDLFLILINRSYKCSTTIELI